MYGEYWYITQQRDGKCYYFVGRENRDRRVWSTNFASAATFVNKERAVDYWKRYADCEGGVTGWEGLGR